MLSFKENVKIIIRGEIGKMWKMWKIGKIGKIKNNLLGTEVSLRR